jgi:hypothetical protein
MLCSQYLRFGQSRGHSLVGRDAFWSLKRPGACAIVRQPLPDGKMKTVAGGGH